jgi:hypothetical protein
LFLAVEIEEALDRGFLAIGPNQDIEPENSSSPWQDKEARRQRLKEWDASSPKEYKVVVLDAKPAMMQKVTFDK